MVPFPPLATLAIVSGLLAASAAAPASAQPADALAGGLAGLLDDAARRDGLVAEGVRAVAPYDWAVVVHSVLRVYELAIAGAGTPRGPGKTSTWKSGRADSESIASVRGRPAGSRCSAIWVTSSPPAEKPIAPTRAGSMP